MQIANIIYRTQNKGLFLHDNVKPHAAKKTHQKIQQYKIKNFASSALSQNVIHWILL